jgi:hypothetical protein
MGNFNLKFTEPMGYNDRRKNSQKLNFLTALGLFAFISILSDWKYGLVFAIFDLTVQRFKSMSSDKHFLTHLILKDDEIYIEYKEENQNKEIIGPKKHFRFKKKLAFNKTKTPYLAVYYKNNLLIKQFEIGNWNEKEFDKVIASI